MSNFRVALGLSFFTFLITLGWTADLQVAVAWSGFVGFIAFLALTVVEFIPYEEDEQREKKDKPQKYEMVLEVIKDNQIVREKIPFDEVWLRILFDDMRRGRGAYAAYREGRADYKRWHVDDLMPILEKMGLAEKTQNYSENGKWVLTPDGMRTAKRLLDGTPPPKLDVLKVRI